MKQGSDLQCFPLGVVRAALVAAAVISAAGGGRAEAQNATAEALFTDGNQRMAEGQLAAACDAFEASNRVEPRAGTLIRLGECREQNQQLASAWSAYKDALTRVKDPRKRQFAVDRAAALELRLSYLTVSVADDSRVDGLVLTRDGKPFEPLLWNRALPVDGGDYVIAGRAPGHEAWQTTAHVPIEGGKISIEVPRFKDLITLVPSPSRPPDRPATAMPARPAAPPPTDEPAPDRAFTARRKVSLGVAAASAALLAAGVLAGEASKRDQRDAFAACPDPAMPCDAADRSNALIDASHHHALEANLAFGAAAAAAITAGVLWFTGAPAERAPRASIVPATAPDHIGIAVVGRF